MKKVVFLLMMMTVLLSSCGEYNKILKSTDYELKYSYAKKYFNAKQYSKSATLLDELVTIFKGTAYAEESLYLLAQSYYGQKDYQTASQYFETYYTTYPKGEFTELSRFYSGYGLYLDSPDPRLDQSQTYKAIEQLQLYLEYYPQSERAEEAQNIMFELQEKLAYKELMATRLYFNLGTYMGNNFQSCVITAQNALKAVRPSTLLPKPKMLSLDTHTVSPDIRRRGLHPGPPYPDPGAHTDAEDVSSYHHR